MTRTSTDFGAGGADADEAPHHLSFARAFTVVVIVLALICTALVVVTQTRGPRLDETRVDASAVTQRTDQQARLFLNESVSTVRSSQVRVTPTTPFTVSTAGTVVTVQFSRRLHSATRYSVAVDGVTSIFGSRDADVETTFTTANAEVLTLDRSATAGGVDRIVEASVNTVGRDVVYEARAFRPSPRSVPTSSSRPMTGARRPCRSSPVTEPGKTCSCPAPGSCGTCLWTRPPGSSSSGSRPREPRPTPPSRSTRSTSPACTEPSSSRVRTGGLSWLPPGV